MHYAVHGHIAVELIYERDDADKLHMGLTTWAAAQEACKVWQEECVKEELHMNNASLEMQSKSFYEESISEMRR